MKLVKNSGNDRVVDELRQCHAPHFTLDVASPAFSLFAFGEVRELLANLDRLWDSLPASPEGKSSLIARLKGLIEHKEPSLIYFLILFDVLPIVIVS
jgi:hypothetical protein